MQDLPGCIFTIGRLRVIAATVAGSPKEKRIMAPLSSLIILFMAAALIVTACGDSTPTATQAPTVPPRVEEGTLEEGAGPEAFLYFMEASSGKYVARDNAGSSDFELIISDPEPLVVFFTDRPHRKAGHEPLEDFIAAWDARGFGDVPPNVTLVVPATKSAMQTVLVAVISGPRWDAETQELAFDGSLIHAHEVAGQAYSQEAIAEVPESLGAVFLFIDTVSIGGCDLGPRALCSQANLSGADLGGLDLHESSLWGTDLSGANLRETNLREANLSGANLSEADLSGANLILADLSWADLTGANLTGANLYLADLTLADLTGADLTGANPSLATICATTMPNGLQSWTDCPPIRRLE